MNTQLSLFQSLSTLARKLDASSHLTDDEESIIKRLTALTRTYSAGDDIVSEGDIPTACALIAEGWACRYKMTGDGKRQILSFHLPGDIPDLQSLLLSRMDHSLLALTDLSVAFVPHAQLRDITAAHPRLARALWRDTLVDASIYREWLLAMGRLSAPQHMAHIFCEIYTRLSVIGLAGPNLKFLFPIAQTDLADAMGLSPVHVNRTLQELRSLGLISWAGGRLTIHDWGKLSDLAEFDPIYLHLAA